MENVMIFDEQKKAWLGIINFVPLVLFSLILAYYLVILSPILAGGHEAGAASGATFDNYTTIFRMLAVAGFISAAVLIYDIVLLARFRHLTAATKTAWIIALSIAVPVSCIAFWYVHIWGARKQVDVYPDIA